MLARGIAQKFAPKNVRGSSLGAALYAVKRLDSATLATFHSEKKKYVSY